MDNEEEYVARRILLLSGKMMQMFAEEDLNVTINALALCVATASKAAQLSDEEFLSRFITSMEGMRDNYVDKRLHNARFEH